MRPVLLAISIFMLAAGVLFLGLASSHVEVLSSPQAVIESSGPNPGRKQTRERPAAVTLTARSDALLSRQDAEESALKKVQADLEKYLRTLEPPITWKPSLEYIRNTLAKGQLKVIEVPLTEAEKQQFYLNSPGDIKSRHRVEDVIEITPPARREMVYFARQDRSEQRLLLLAPVLAGVVLLLLAASSYIHLDERSKGYYTGWLRIAAVGAIAACVAIGWWWFTQGPAQ